jgi:hypothetical protein
MTPSPQGSIASIIAGLRAAQAGLAARPVEEVVAALDRVVEAWLAVDSPLMAAAVRELPATTGFSPEMIRFGLPRLLEPLRGDDIRALLARELPRGRAGDRGSAPRLIASILPGNIPGLAAAALLLPLAVRAASLVKPGAGDRWFPDAFAASIAAEDVQLGRCVAAVYWPGGSRDVEDVVFAEADVVEAAGSDEAIAAIAPRVRGRFVGHGSRISFALVGREVAADEAALGAAARGIAEDVSIWDQQGCLSPQVVFVEAESPLDLDRAATGLARALDEWTAVLPPRRLSPDETAAVLHFRHEAEWAGLGRGGRALFGPALTWCVVVEPAPALRPTCLYRTLRVQPVDDLAAVIHCLAPMRPWLEAAGVAISASRRVEAETALRRAGVHRVCAVGAMQRPDLTWAPGGRGRVAAWMGDMG